MGNADSRVGQQSRYFVEWALAKSKLRPQPRDIRRLLRSQVMDALRQAVRTDEEGITYRAKQCVRSL